MCPAQLNVMFSANSVYKYNKASCSSTPTRQVREQQHSPKAWSVQKQEIGPYNKADKDCATYSLVEEAVVPLAVGKLVKQTRP